MSLNHETELLFSLESFRQISCPLVEEKHKVKIILGPKCSRSLLLSCPVYLSDFSTFPHQVMLLCSGSCGLSVVLDKIFLWKNPQICIMLSDHLY